MSDVFVLDDGPGLDESLQAWGLSPRSLTLALLITPREISVLRGRRTSVNALCVCLCLIRKKSTWASSPDDQRFPFKGVTAAVENI